MGRVPGGVWVAARRCVGRSPVFSAERQDVNGELMAQARWRVWLPGRVFSPRCRRRGSWPQWGSWPRTRRGAACLGTPGRTALSRSVLCFTLLFLVAFPKRITSADQRPVGGREAWRRLLLEAEAGLHGVGEDVFLFSRQQTQTQRVCSELSHSELPVHQNVLTRTSRAHGRRSTLRGRWDSPLHMLCSVRVRRFLSR